MQPGDAMWGTSTQPQLSKIHKKKQETSATRDTTQETKKNYKTRNQNA